jgi:hypothetical protein
MPILGNIIPPTVDLKGTELILDADADTSITADTDDQIDIKIAGADDFQFTANTFTAQSGSTIAAQALTATTISATGDVTVTNIDTDANAGPILNLYRNSASPADDDRLGEIQFKGENSASQIVEYGSILGTSYDITDGEEDGAIHMTIMVAGSETNAFRLASRAGTASIVQALHSEVSSAAIPAISFIGDYDTGMYHVGANQIGFSTNSTKRMEINNTDVEISTGNIVFETAGKGVYLGVTSATAANLLDDYEEGQYTAVLTTSTSGGYNLAGGYDLLTYTKIGRTVHVFGRIDVASDNSPNGQLQLSLPFTSVNLTEYSDTGYFNCAVFSAHADSDASADIVGWIESSVAVLKFYEVVHGTGAASSLAEDEVDTAFGISINLTYIAA